MNPAICRHLGTVAYPEAFECMQAFTQHRDANTPDEVWLLEHPPVLTLGRQARREFLLSETNIPIADTDRAGHVTYHGPGQMIAYTLIDIKRLGIGPKVFVQALEQSIIDLCQRWGLNVTRKAHAPGLYVAGDKLCSLGLRIKHGCVYHGLALNLNCNLQAFECIAPCGYRDLAMTRLIDHGVHIDMPSLQQSWSEVFQQCLETSRTRLKAICDE